MNISSLFFLVCSLIICLLLKSSLIISSLISCSIYYVDYCACFYCGYFVVTDESGQSGFQSDAAVPLNNEVFLGMMSNSGSGGLVVAVNLLTRYYLIVITCLNRDLLSIV